MSLSSSSPKTPIESLPIRTLKHSNALFSSGSGYALMIRMIQYISKILAHSKARGALHYAKLASLISDARFVYRFWGFFDSLQDVHFAVTSGALSPLNRSLEFVKATSMIAYYPLEHLYWLKWRRVLPAGEWLDVDQFSYWSCRFWVLYIIADMIQDLSRMRFASRTPKAKLVYAMKWLRNICDLLLGWHWSVEGGLFNEGEVGWLGTVGTTASMIGLVNSK